MDRLLIDTDAILDFFFDRRPFADHAAQVFTFCETKKAMGFVTAVIVSNTYYMLRQTATHDKVIEKLKELMEIVDVLPTDKNTVLKAMNSGFKDFEDALQNYTAELTDKVDVIITRNVKDYKNSKLNVMKPSEYIALSSTR